MVTDYGKVYGDLLIPHRQGVHSLAYNRLKVDGDSLYCGYTSLEIMYSYISTLVSETGHNFVPTNQ